jgi:hypothetical protein
LEVRVIDDILHPGPERAKDGRPLPPIANELLLEILEYIVPGPSFTSGEAKKMLGALSRTCRFFASVCVPRLFREIEYTPTSPAPIFTWARMIQKIQPEALAVCQHVESLSFHDWSSKDSQLFLNFGMVTLTRLPRLAHLSFYRMNVSRKAIDAIANMDDLNSLHLEYCSFGPDDVPFARSRVRELSVIHALWAGHVEEAVTRLADPHVLRVLRTNRFSLALRLIHTGATFTVLDVLEITARDVELDESEQQLLAGFFKNTPVLRVLAVTLPSRWRAAVSPDVLRQLSQLKAPLGLLLKVGSDHPISSLDLVLPYFSNSDISVTLDPDKLGSSFSWKTLLSRLVELEISSVLRVPGGILAHTDRLEVFTINCENTFQKKTHQVNRAPSFRGPSPDRAA